MQELTAPKPINNASTDWIKNLTKKVESEATALAKDITRYIETLFGVENTKLILACTNENNQSIVEIITIQILKECTIKNKTTYDEDLIVSVVQNVITDWLINNKK